jgi:choline dehydrogenase-like flavoprotein
LGTPRILLNSKSKNFPNGLANSSGMVGKNLMLHPVGWVEGKFSKFLKSYDGPQGCSITSSQFLTKKNKHFEKGYLIQILREPHPVEQSVIKNKLGKLNFGKKFFDNFFNFYGKTVSAAVICEDLPEAKNRLILERFKKKQDDIPNIKIKYKLSDNSKKMISHGIKNCVKLMKLAGAKEIYYFGPVKHAGWHIMGTARMGASKKNSVVNKNGRCHDINNLFIVDSSIFTSSSGVNPVSTICALSFKISDYIKENFCEKFNQ